MCLLPAPVFHVSIRETQIASLRMPRRGKGQPAPQWRHDRLSSGEIHRKHWGSDRIFVLVHKDEGRGWVRDGIHVPPDAIPDGEESAASIGQMADSIHVAAETVSPGSLNPAFVPDER